MFTYLVTVEGRRSGAIGVFYPITRKYTTHVPPAHNLEFFKDEFRRENQDLEINYFRSITKIDS